ncbi:MAG TPA: UvrD-helicase domain-containing protein [Planctomycetota bacterium]|nr:UvrD-helicase domain-containing protein [Planctomycetota bacterium]
MAVDIERIFENLNPPQREAVETIDGPLLILAGAGSGKTRVVTRRIANIMARGARPWEVLAITFTNKAAGEMKRRVEDLVGVSGAWISTFHSFCARLLRREAEALGYTRDFTIYDDEDSMDMVKDIFKEMGLDRDDKRLTPRAIRQEISAFKNKVITPEEVPDGMFHERLIKQVYAEYEKALRKNLAFDFDDLLIQSVQLFRSREDILDRYRSRFRYVLVDEYQDTNACQYHLIKLLGSKHRNVCATGDPDQSIYAWRGADVRNILSFEKDFPEAKIVKLEQNYRSTKLILQAADSVIAHNVERKPKTLWTENLEGEALTLIEAEDEQMESYQVAKRIGEHMRFGKRCNDIAVFYRTNAQSRAIETALIQSNIPYQLIGGTAFYERREIKDAMAYLRLIVNPKDDAAFRRVINVPKRALGESAVEQIEIEANRRECSLIETLDGPDAERFIASFKPKPKQGLVQFARLMDQLRAMPTYPVADVLRTMLDESGLHESLEASGEKDRVENLDELVNAAAEFDKENDPANVVVPEGPPPEPGAFDGAEELAQRNASLAGFLENSALLAPTDKFDPNADRVTLMTLHMAKGLEFPIVFLTGLEEGLLPLIRTAKFGPDSFEKNEDPKAIEEERRLMYVGITRAMEKLYLTLTRFRMKYGRTDQAVPSRFLEEIPEKLFEAREARAKALHSADVPFDMEEDETPTFRPKKQAAPDPFADFEREVAQEFSAPAASSQRPRRIDPAVRHIVDKIFAEEVTQEDPRAFEPGDRVRHDTFGEGVVDALTGSGLSQKIRINFRKDGMKLLLLSMAGGKLTKV